jgi:hypothetical protein
MSIGLSLSQRFFDEVVAPLMVAHMPALRHAAARLGDGSEVLGFDTEISADHNYGPTLQLFLSEEDFAPRAAALMAMLDESLPETIDGWPIRFPSLGRPGKDVPGMVSSDHGVELYTLEAWTERQLGIDPGVRLLPADWLGLPEQRLLTVTAGAVFCDDIGALTALRERLSYLPRDIWLLKLAAQWSRIGEEMAFVGRTGENGDELGSRIITARLAHDVMRLCFLVERRYAPYSKWFGAAFARLDCASQLAPLLEQVLRADAWQPRQQGLAAAYEYVGEVQSARGVPGAIAPRIHLYYDRPFTVINAGEIASSLREAIEDPATRALPDFGAIDQFSDATPLLTRPDLTHRIIGAISG